MKSNLRFPEWFKEEIGFCFLDDDGDECIYLGVSGYRSYDLVQVRQVLNDGREIGRRTEWGVCMLNSVDVYCYKYKGEWQFSDLQKGLQDD